MKDNSNEVDFEPFEKIVSQLDKLATSNKGNKEKYNMYMKDILNIKLLYLYKYKQIKMEGSKLQTAEKWIDDCEKLFSKLFVNKVNKKYS